MFMRAVLLSFLVLGAGCSTKANPNACCVSADDCAQAGLSSTTSCDQGLTCVNNQCIQQTCSTDGCTVDKPVCTVVTNVCDGCTTASDCTTDKPVGDTGTCRACVADADCESGACADDGTCVAESAIIY